MDIDPMEVWYYDELMLYGQAQETPCGETALGVSEGILTREGKKVENNAGESTKEEIQEVKNTGGHNAYTTYR